MNTNFINFYSIAFLILLLSSCSNTETQKTTLITIKDTTNYIVQEFSDSTKNTINDYVKPIGIDSINLCDLTENKPVFKWIKKIGTIKFYGSQIFIETKQLKLLPCNMHISKLGKDSSILFSGISYENKTKSILYRRISYSTILTEVYIK